MARPKPERWIAISVIISAAVLVATLTLILGHWEFNPDRRTVTAYFPSCTGVELNSPVRYAGAQIGRVLDISVVPRSQQKQADGNYYYVKIAIGIDRSVEIGQDALFEIKQDGVLGAKFIAITPVSPDAPLLADNAVVLGAAPIDLMDLAAPGKELLAKLVPVADHLTELTASLDQSVPPLILKVDAFLGDGDKLLANVGSEENRQRLSDLLANLRVVSDNLKVVSTNAKAFTATLGQRPWRLLFGGKPNDLPSEQEILSSDKPIPAPGN